MPRKPFGRMFELLILNSLDTIIPHTIEHVRSKVSEKLGKKGLSWHTIRKYLIALRDSQQIEEVHSGKVVTYRLRR